MNDKLKTISNLFENKEIRSIWDPDKEEYLFSVIDVIGALTDSVNPRDYWYQLKKRMSDIEKSEVSTKCRQLKMKASDGKLRLTDTLDTEGIFRLIESVPSPKAEPFKLWLAKLGKENIDEIFDPSIGIDKMVDYYLKKGYTLEWIKARVNAIIDRKKLTNAWMNHGINDNLEYALLTNEIYKTWSGMNASEYKKYKNIRKENLRDNMSDIELAITNIGELTTRDIVNNKHPIGLDENIKSAKKGGIVAKRTKEFYEEATGLNAITKNNNLTYKYIDDMIEISNKE